MRSSFARFFVLKTTCSRQLMWVWAMRGILARHHVVGRVVVHMVGGRMYA